MDFRPHRFIEDDPNGIIKLNNISPPRMPSTVPAYPLSFDLLDKSLPELEKLLEKERSENSKLNEAWNYVEGRFPKASGRWPGDERNIPRPLGLAAYVYSIEHPVNVYGEFNLQTRTADTAMLSHCFHYKALFAFLHQACMLDNTLKKRKPVLYRGCSVKFGGVTNGDGITFRSFTSTSESKRVAQHFLEGSSGASTYFEIHDAELGVSMSDMSHYPGEEEFLLQPTEVFRVDHIQQIGIVRKIVLRSTKTTTMRS